MVVLAILVLTHSTYYRTGRERTGGTSLCCLAYLSLMRECNMCLPRTMLSDEFNFFSTFASSAPSGIIGNIIQQFHMSREVAILTISLFVAGYCVGPLLWGPLSEQIGRKPVFVISFVVYTVIPLPLSPNRILTFLHRVSKSVVHFPKIRRRCSSSVS